jgi:hypothetical protein
MKTYLEDGARSDVGTRGTEESEALLAEDLLAVTETPCEVLEAIKGENAAVGRLEREVPSNITPLGSTPMLCVGRKIGRADRAVRA